MQRNKIREEVMLFKLKFHGTVFLVASS